MSKTVFSHVPAYFPVILYAFYFYFWQWFQIIFHQWVRTGIHNLNNKEVFGKDKFVKDWDVISEYFISLPARTTKLITYSEISTKSNSPVLLKQAVLLF